MKCYIKGYPRPQLVRTDWQSLDGKWDFSFDDGNIGERSGYPQGFDGERQILVPFTYETEMSGIHDETEHGVVWYQKTVTLHPEEGKRLLLHFEGSDYITKVWVNGAYQGSHQGACERFTFDITAAVREGENRIVIRAADSASLRQPRGKQRWLKDSYACWYVPTTGIWKTVWLEKVPELYIDRIRLTPDLDRAEIEIAVDLTDAGHGEGSWSRPLGEYFLKADISLEGNPVCCVCSDIHDTHVTLRADVRAPWTGSCTYHTHVWSPENPALYDLELSVVGPDGEVDRVGSYFGMREIRIEKGNILLNGSPIYQRLILDQGYWEKSGLTAPDEDALVRDIDKIHALGYNGLRKHMKVEDERFLYWCDVRGMLVWSEMAACYTFDDDALDAYTREWLDVVRQNYSHPSIITWTPFNESWGIPSVKRNARQQHFTEAIYHLTKAIDPMRPVITNDGWEHTVSDIITLHDYEEDGAAFLERYLNHKDEILSNHIYHSKDRCALADGFEYHGQPVILSEYGGIAFAGGKDGEWGYGGNVKNEQEFLERFRRITNAIKAVPYICGYCYTQATDVQQEVNGLMYPDRRFKMDPEKIAGINLAETALHH